MDRAKDGKNGVINHVLRAVNPAGLRLPRSPHRPREELANHFLWRINKQLPGAGMTGVFNRSHNEDRYRRRAAPWKRPATWSMSAPRRHLDWREPGGALVIQGFSDGSSGTDRPNVVATTAGERHTLASRLRSRTARSRSMSSPVRVHVGDDIQLLRADELRRSNVTRSTSGRSNKGLPVSCRGLSGCVGGHSPHHE